MTGVLLLTACGSAEGCEPSAPVTDACTDLSFGGREYVEWREVDPPRIPQEVGNATYPACNAAETCVGADLDGFGATDVWLFHDADVADAVIGLRQGTHTYVIFVRVGLDPEDVDLVALSPPHPA